MDRRWIAIIAILILGLSGMYYATVISPTVGNAITTVNDIIVTLPLGFELEENDIDFATIYDKNKDESFFIQYLADGNQSLKEYKKAVKFFKNNDTVEIIGNESDDGVHTLFYKDLSNNRSYSASYFCKFDRTLLVKMGTSDDVKNHKGDLKYIIDNMRPDYKQDRS